MIAIIFKHHVSDQTNVSECDWSNQQIFLFVDCDTQGVKNYSYH